MPVRLSWTKLDRAGEFVVKFVTGRNPVKSSSKVDMSYKINTATCASSRIAKERRE